MGNIVCISCAGITGAVQMITKVLNESIVCISCAELTGGAHKRPSMNRLAETVKLYSEGQPVEVYHRQSAGCRKNINLGTV